MCRREVFVLVLLVVPAVRAAPAEEAEAPRPAPRPSAKVPPPAPSPDSSPTSPATMTRAVVEETDTPAPTDESRGVPPSALSLGVDLLAREGHLSPVGRIGGRVALRDDFGLTVAVGLANPYSVFYRLFEEQAVIGVGYRVVPFARVWLDTTAAVGVLVHEYRAQGGSGWATVPDGLGVVTFSGGVALARHVGVELRVAPGVHTRSSHPDVAEVWSTSWFVLEAGAGVVVY